MNKTHYVNVKKCKDLIDRGINLDTDQNWYLYSDGWELGQRMFVSSSGRIPAPTMMEIYNKIWKLLGNNDDDYRLVFYKNGVSLCSSTDESYFDNGSIVDALADLLIFVNDDCRKKDIDKK